MTVMTAGMHPPRMIRGKRQTGTFDNRQRVHIGPQTDNGARRIGGADIGNNAGPADDASVNPPFRQFMPDKGGGPVLLVTQLRIPVEMTTNGQQPLVQRVVDTAVQPISGLIDGRLTQF
jgi:hypothetical protein